jgi:hypothetical protein
MSMLFMTIRSLRSSAFNMRKSLNDWPESESTSEQKTKIPRRRAWAGHLAKFLGVRNREGAGLTCYGPSDGSAATEHQHYCGGNAQPHHDGG